MVEVNKEKSEYPMVMDVKHVCEVLGVSKRRGYEIMEIEGFPLVRNIGRQKRAHRDKFFKWLEEQAS